MREDLRNLESIILALKDTGRLFAIKAEFEAEGTRIEELIILSELCCNKNIDLTLKVGGPSAQRDFYEAFQLGAKNILIPMVESEYSLLSSFETYSKTEVLTVPDLNNSTIDSFDKPFSTKAAVIDSIFK